MRMVNKKIFLCLFLVQLCLYTLYSQTVVSPTEGVWANYQSLVLNIDESKEAFYSLSGENPLESGFAYDGPALIKLDGDIVVDIAIVSDDGSTDFYNVHYSVNLQNNLEYIPSNEEQATLIVNGNDTIVLPENIQYSLANSSIFSKGEELQISGPMIFERNILLTIHDGTIPYRYVLQIGGDKSNNLKTTISESPIEINDWNYITFLQGGPIIYSIDDGELRQTASGKIFVDRSVDHTLQWKASTENSQTEFATILLPKKPELQGLPSSTAVNSPVNLSLSDSRYMFVTYKDKEQVVFTNHYLIDTLKGDAFGFSNEIEIYHDGIKHGSFNPAFIIDKIAPSAPLITASNSTGYARQAVDVTIQASDTVFYYIPSTINSKTGFNSDTYQSTSNSQYQDLKNYSVLNSTKLTLSNNSNLAQLQELYVFTKDYAGNKSDIVSFKTVVDPYNYYVTQNNSNESGESLGTIDKPFTDFLQIYALLNAAPLINIYVDGIFTDISTLEISQNATIQSTDSSRLIFASGQSIQVKNASLTITGGTIEQSNPDSSNSLQNTLLHATNATVTLDNTELLLTGGINSNCISSENSSIQILDSGLTVQTLAYGAGVKANDSVVLSQGSRFVSIAETAIGMSLVNTTTQVKESTFDGIGALSRSLEFINSSYSILDNTFIFNETNSNRKIEYPAIWKDEFTQENLSVNNVFDGFTSLVVKN